MSIVAARAYIAGRIALVDSTITEITTDPLAIDPIASPYPERFYKLVFGDCIQTNTAGNAYGLEIQTNLIIYAAGHRDELTTYDTLYAKAISIRNEILNPCEVKSQPNFSDIVGVSITPGSEDTDDKLYRMDLEFILRIDNYYT